VSITIVAPLQKKAVFIVAIIVVRYHSTKHINANTQMSESPYRYYLYHRIIITIKYRIIITITYIHP